jgi:hypothetical protein
MSRCVDTQLSVGSSASVLEPMRDASYDRPVALTEDFGDREPAVGLSAGSAGVCPLATRLTRPGGAPTIDLTAGPFS